MARTQHPRAFAAQSWVLKHNCPQLNPKPCKPDIAEQRVPSYYRYPHSQPDHCCHSLAQLDATKHCWHNLAQLPPAAAAVAPSGASPPALPHPSLTPASHPTPA
mmetsp:Transcript_31225/g.79619  ORF Transcript_31225/g.79619 Transcript_31225/m.79619 type:complete len:104 (-) Transcript_31225:486-797(-)